MVSLRRGWESERWLPTSWDARRRLCRIALICLVGLGRAIVDGSFLWRLPWCHRRGGYRYRGGDLGILQSIPGLFFYVRERAEEVVVPDPDPHQERGGN